MSSAEPTAAVLPIPPARVVFSDADRAEILALVDESLRSGSLTLGPLGRRFEDDFAARHGARHAAAVASGTAALEIILRAAGVAGRQVVVPANTFYATAGAVVHAGAQPRFGDVEAPTLAVSAATLAAAITPATAAVVVVHIGGVITPEMDAIAALCEERGLLLIEDAAHAHGATLDGRPAGSWGTAAAWSFYPTKVLTAGEGGMVTTDDESLAAEVRIYRDQGKASFLGGGHVRMGAAWRMSEVHAAVGLVHLHRLDDFVGARRAAAAVLDAGIATVGGLEPLAVPARCASNYYKYPVLLAPGVARDTVKARLRDEYRIGLSGEVYATPLHHEPVFAGLDHPPLPGAEDLCARHVCLPVHSDMTPEEAERIVEAVRVVVPAATR